ncbi:hypothetical protein BT69DRAFT_1317333 [Atractiella rhizophila]|nr:hypothetical protein BT69DRAFT_1317333 [Atractiella rhizophila]
MGNIISSPVQVVSISSSGIKESTIPFEEARRFQSHPLLKKIGLPLRVKDGQIDIDDGKEVVFVEADMRRPNPDMMNILSAYLKELSQVRTAGNTERLSELQTQAGFSAFALAWMKEQKSSSSVEQAFDGCLKPNTKFQKGFMMGGFD